MYVGFSLKVENEIDQFFVQLVHCFFEKIFGQIAGWARKLSKPTWAFGAAQIAGGGGFDGHGKWQPPLNGLPRPFCEVKRRQDFCHIPSPPNSEFGKEIQGIMVRNFHTNWSCCGKGTDLKGLICFFLLLANQLSHVTFTL